MQHEIKIADKTIVMVGVRSDLFNLRIVNDKLCYDYHDIVNGYKNLVVGVIALPEGDYKLLGTWPGLTEEQAAWIVEKTDNPFFYGQDLNFIDYINDRNCFKTSIESFASLMEATQLYTVNPYPNPETIIGQYYDPPFDGEFVPSPYSGTMLMNKYREDKQKHQHAQERTSPMWVIVEKVK